MSEPYIGQIILFGGNFAPLGWAYCDGSVLSIADNSALFSLIGTTYGGDGIQTFGLPDLRGRAPIHRGQGPGLQNYDQGQKAGSETVTLQVTQLPAHNHGVSVGASNNAPSTTRPAGAVYAASTMFTDAANAGGSLGAVTVAAAGGNGAHDNMEPYLALNYIIALEGIFPSRN
jgi:microcystin-dependent protein